MMQIEIHKTDVDEFSGISNRTKQPFTIRKQEAWAVLPGEPYPRLIKIPLGAQQAPYPVGKYELDSRSFEVNKFDELGLRPVLKKAG